MSYHEMKNKIESGEWIKEALPDLSPEELLRVSICFQETYALMLEREAEERVEEEAARHRVVEDIRMNGYDEVRVNAWKGKGWRVTKRVTKVLDVETFLKDHLERLPTGALSVVKSKLPPALRKVIKDYEQITGHTFSAKRYQSDADG
jgi:hypothetical protein